MRSMADHVRAMLAFQQAGAVVFDYGNNLRAQAQEAGVADAFDYPGFVPAFIRPQFCEGRGPVPLGGAVRRSRGHPPHRPRDPRAVPGGRGAPALDRDGGGTGAVPGAARPASAGSATASGRRPAWRSTSWSRTGEVKAPIVIGRDHLDSGSVASPNRETEAMARRLRRGRRLAAPQRPREHRGRRDVGVDPSRRRDRDRVLASTPGWWWSPTARSSPREARAGPDHGPGRWASCATSTPATSARSRSPASVGVHIPMLDG